jgi:uncharacterized protein YlxP (DUF503 family)
LAEVEKEDVHQIASNRIAFTCKNADMHCELYDRLESFVEDETEHGVAQKETELLTFENQIALIIYKILLC